MPRRNIFFTHAHGRDTFFFDMVKDKMGQAGLEPATNGLSRAEEYPTTQHDPTAISNTISSLYPFSLLDSIGSC